MSSFSDISLKKSASNSAGSKLAVFSFRASIPSGFLEYSFSLQINLLTDLLLIRFSCEYEDNA